jgi:putative ATPase
MLEGGEDPKFIARRLVISASEDIGNADPRALQVAVSCQQAVDFVGMPEAGINLSQAVCYLASAPKSNRAYLAYKQALQVVRQTGNLEIPLSIRNAPTKMMKEQGYGEGYQYAHNYKQGKTSQVFLPESIKDSVFYEPKDSGYEKHIKAYLDFMKSKN